VYVYFLEKLSYAELYMKSQNLLIYEFETLYEILSEISEFTSFNVLKISKNEINEVDLKYQSKYLIVTKNNNLKNKYQLNLKEFPVTLSKLIEIFNIEFLKIKFTEQAEVSVGKYKININSRQINYGELSLKLTEKEINFVLYLSRNKNHVKIDELQAKVWGHHLKLDTHTVETHIYRLRKKILKVFGDKNFIITSKDGYQIKGSIN